MISSFLISLAFLASDAEETWPLPLQEPPPVFYAVQFSANWPDLPTEARVKAIASAGVDLQLVKKIQNLPDDAVSYHGSFFGLGRVVSDQAEQCVRDADPVVDRTLLAILDDPDTRLQVFRLCHHLLMARYNSSVFMISPDAAPVKIGAASELSRPVDADRPAIRAYWHVLFGENEYLEDFVSLLDPDSFRFRQNRISGQLIAGTGDLGTLFAMRCSSPEAYYLLKPLLEDKKRFAIAHVLLGLKLTGVRSVDADQTYLKLPLLYDKEYKTWSADPAGFDAVRSWWEARRRAVPNEFELSEKLGKRAVKQWAEQRSQRVVEDVVPGAN